MQVLLRELAGSAASLASGTLKRGYGRIAADPKLYVASRIERRAQLRLYILLRPVLCTASGRDCYCR